MFESSWTRCWKSIGAKGLGTELMHQLIDAYSESQRKYHTVQHLRECLASFEQFIACAREPGEVEIALWFHDAVYDVKGSDNEAKSAEWAVRELQNAEVRPSRIARVSEHILATKHSALPKGPDQELLIDIDLSILGSDPERFNEYERQVREEYSYVPGFIFRRSRKQILTQFLARNPIFSTLELRNQFEDKARKNIEASLAKLGG
jgi:predicted metal-dependent HD superfamily phosphohydrolase